ncbi:MAG: FmdB family zinc ribbon protein [Propionibacteriaceae bacterium]
MPTYQYRCTECDNELEAVQKFTDPSLTDCPTCEGRLRKIFNAVGVVFKGSGFYRTDSRTENKSDSDSGSSSDKSSAGKSDSTSGSKPDGDSGSKESASTSDTASSGSAQKSASTAGAASSS